MLKPARDRRYNDKERNLRTTLLGKSDANSFREKWKELFNVTSLQISIIQNKILTYTYHINKSV